MKVPTFLVILDIRSHGSSYGTTRDEVEAPSADEAIAKAIRAWRKLRPDRTFHPLYSEPVAVK